MQVFAGELGARTVPTTLTYILSHSCSCWLFKAISEGTKKGGLCSKEAAAGQLQGASSSHHHITRHTLKVDPQPKGSDG